MAKQEFVEFRSSCRNLHITRYTNEEGRIVGIFNGRITYADEKDSVNWKTYDFEDGVLRIPTSQIQVLQWVREHQYNEGSPNCKGMALFHEFNYEAVQREYNDKQKLKAQMMSIVVNLSPKELERMALLCNTSVQEDMLLSGLIELTMNNAELFAKMYEVRNSTDNKALVLFRKAVTSNVISAREAGYLFGNIFLGASEGDSVRYLLNSENASVRMAIEERCDFKEDVLKSEEPSVGRRARTQPSQEKIELS